MSPAGWHGIVARRWVVVGVVALIGAAFSGAPLVVGVAADPLDGSPSRTRDATGSALLDAVYERLVDFDTDGEPIPALATSWAWVAPDRWEIVLRRDVRFTNGEAFDAETVRRNLDLQRRDFRSPARTWLQTIVTVEVLDDHTVAIVTDGPQPELPHALAWAGRMAPTVYGFDGSEYAERLLRAPVGTGPFRVTAWERGRSMHLEANPDWWGPPPAARTIDVRVLPDGADRVAAFLAGAVDMVTDLGVDERAVLAAAGAPLVPLPGQRLVYLVMDTHRARGGAAPDGSPGIPAGAPNPLVDARVRVALYRAIDRDALVRDALGGAAVPAWQPMLPGSQAHHPGLEAAPHDPSAARSALAAAGYPDGFAVTVTGLVGTIPRALETLAFVVESLRSVGIDARLETPPYAEAARRYGLLEVTLGMVSWGGLTSPLKAWTAMAGSDPDAGTYGSQNVGRYSNRAVNALLAHLRTEPDPDRRRAAFLELAEVFLEEMPVIPLYLPTDAVALGTSWSLSPTNLDALPLRDVRPAGH